MIEFFYDHAETIGMLIVPALVLVATLVTKRQRIEQHGDRVEVKDDAR